MLEGKVIGYHAGTHILKNKEDIDPRFFNSYKLGGKGLYFGFSDDRIRHFGPKMHEFFAIGQVFDINTPDDQELFLKEGSRKGDYMHTGDFFDWLAKEYKIDIIRFNSLSAVIKNLDCIKEWRYIG